MSTLIESKTKKTKRVAVVSFIALFAYFTVASHIDDQEHAQPLLVVSDLNVGDTESHALNLNISIDLGDKLNRIVRIILD
ncbi:hypothetical protein ISG33_07955 [Glaciecola sp. MH2013]|uniref:hypothetical protein n=1 Tax=Glaciecola sp. MH2013 TaxID=2785524 RepID=UPI00189E279A|nr:hypothetical protein [Glaciecola sp. MH2013]MBF7073326.1 hypothetical protein [Glaciecola sp. MH2013]